uniref:Coupling protein TraD n=1 Tax=Klebsiella pneumoniae TaxID=573 RepID=A0A2P1BNX3_KLEPN|nr:Coupling protein TraD [Klebsiella pneumoniae]
MFGIQSYAQLEDIYGVKPAATLFDVMNTGPSSAPRVKRLRSLLPVKLVKEILKASEQYSYGADPVRDGVSTGKEKSGKRWSVTPIFRRCLTCPVTSRCRAVSGRETGPQIQAASENCRGIYSSHSRCAGGCTAQCAA